MRGSGRISCRRLAFRLFSIVMTGFRALPSVVTIVMTGIRALPSLVTIVMTGFRALPSVVTIIMTGFRATPSRVAMITAALLALPLPAKADIPIPPGSYAGTSDKGIDIGLRISGTGDPFELAFTLDGTVFKRTFEPEADGSGYIGMETSMFSVFGVEDESNPIDGDRMLWARESDGHFIIYSMQIDDNGHYAIGRFELAPSGDNLELQMETLRHAEDTVVDTALLEKR